MSTFKVTLEIDRVGDKEAMAALDVLAAKSKVVQSGQTGLTTATREASREFGEHGKAINKIGRALEGLATETLGARSQFGLIAGELAKMTLGGAWVIGITAGIAAIGLAYDKLTEKTREAKKAQEELRLKIAEAANAGQADLIAAEARKVQFGQPFDKEGKLVANSRFVPGAFAGSMLDVQAQLADAQNRFYSTKNGFEQQQIQQEIIRLKKQLEPLQASMTALRSAASNVASQPADNSGRLPTITTAAAGTATRVGAQLGKSVADAYQRELASDLAAATKIAVQQGVENAEVAYQAQHAILDGLIPTKEQIAEAIRRVAQEISEAIANDPILKAANAAKQMGEQMGHMLSDGIAGSLVSALDAGFEKAFSGSGAVGFIQGFGQAILGALGSLMEQMGGALMAYGIAMTLFADGMTNPFTSGPAAIAAGAALATLGAALSAAVRGHGGGGGSGSYSGGYSSSTGLAQIYDRGVINPDTYSSRSPANIATMPFVVLAPTIFGTDSAVAQRGFDEMMRKSLQRGSLAGART